MDGRAGWLALNGTSHQIRALRLRDGSGVFESLLSRRSRSPVSSRISDAGILAHVSGSTGVDKKLAELCSGALTSVSAQPDPRRVGIDFQYVFRAERKWPFHR